MDPLSKLERLILSILEEAGEEHVSALANTVERCLTEGLPNTIQPISDALIHLISADLVRLAKVRDPVRGYLVPLSVDQSVLIARSLELLLEGRPTDGPQS